MKTGKTVQKGIIVLVMAVMLMNMIGRIDVSAAQNFLTPAQATGKFDFHIEPGEERHFLIPVKANQWINIKALSAETSNDGIKVTNVTVSDPLFETTDYLNGIDLNPGRIYNLEFDVQASDALKIGYNTISIYGTGEYYIDEFSSMNNELLMTLTSYTSRELKPVEIVIEKAEYDESLVYPDKKFTMKLKLKNVGERMALNAYLSMDFGSSGIIPDYQVEKIKIGTLDQGATKVIDVPVKVLKNAEPGFYSISAMISCKDNNGTEQGPFSQNMYITVNKPKEETPVKTEQPVIELSTSTNYAVLKPDTEDSLKVTVKNTGKADAFGIKISVLSGFDASIGITKGYTSDYIFVGDLKSGESKEMEIPVRVAKGFAPGLYEIQMAASFKDEKENEKTSQNMTMYVKGLEEKKEEKTPVKSSLVLSTEDNYAVLKPDSEHQLVVIAKNTGDTDVTAVKLDVISGLDTNVGLTKGYTTDGISVGDLKAGEEKKIKVPVVVAKNFSSGLFEIQMSASYLDSQNTEKTSPVMTMYVKGPEEKPKETNINGVSIGNVSQSPEAPVAGERVTVSFDVINDGTADITNVKVAGTGLSASSFEPVSSEPYKKIGTIKAGSRARVSMTFKVGKDIPEGFNTLNVNCEYTTSEGISGSESAGLYVLNVVNEKKEESNEQKTSRPKLIINQYSAEPVIDLDMVEEDEDIDKLMHELKAGGIFNFTYSIKNTHATKAAKNIKITVEQSEGIFIPVEGSNIFYIDAIEAGETSEQVIPMKTRSDVATGDYNILIRVEYEYDDMTEVDKEKGGVVDESNIKLRAVENYRPEIENIYVEAYDGVTVGNPVDLSFEFYNMGKSTLGNVYITIEGDFELANNSSKTYVGAVNGYSQEYVNPQIVPLVPGEATGIIVVHFEDSNGDEQIKTAEFSTFVMGGDDFYGDYGDIDWGNLSGDFYNPDFPGYDDSEFDPDGMDGDSEEGTKIIGLPLWLFITICSSVVVIAAVIIIVVVVKKKRKKAFMDEDDE